MYAEILKNDFLRKLKKELQSRPINGDDCISIYNHFYLGGSVTDFNFVKSIPGRLTPKEHAEVYPPITGRGQIYIMQYRLFGELLELSPLVIIEDNKHKLGLKWEVMGG